MTTTKMKDHADSKYTEEYFQNRINELTEDLVKNHLPSGGQRSDAVFAGHEVRSKGEIPFADFAQACTSVQASNDAVVKAKKLVDKINADKDLYTNEDEWTKTQTMVADISQTATQAYDQTVLTAEAIAEPLLTQYVLPKLWNNIIELPVLECTLLIEATPKGLADWVALNPDKNSGLLDACLQDVNVMREIVMAGGPADGHLGLALELYDTLLASWRDARQQQQGEHGEHGKSDDDDVPALVQAIARATSLQLATPINVFAHAPTDDNPQTIDPVDRFWHYVKAHDAGELDEQFDKLDLWTLRMAMDSDAPSDQLQWARDMIKVYRPDYFLRQDQWQYCRIVRSDVGYRHPDGPMDTYPNVLSSGGECGPRAWFGRYMCKAFGMPTWGLRQPGHAAMSRWVPSRGWVTCLGLDFDKSWWKDSKYPGGRREGLDFLAECHAREATTPELYYRTVRILECVSVILGQAIVGIYDPAGLWRSLSLAQRNIHAHKYVPPTVRENGEAMQPWVGCHRTGTKHFAVGICAKFTAQTTIGDNNEIIIPATSFTDPASDTDSVLTMPSFLEGGTQLHLRDGGGVTYTLPEFGAGWGGRGDDEKSYSLTFRYATVHRHQVPIQITVETNDPDRSSGKTESVPIIANVSVTVDGNDDTARSYDDCSVPLSDSSIKSDGQCNDGNLKDNSYTIEPGYTVGKWATSDPILISISSGCKLAMTRESPAFGITIKDFMLVPN